MTKPLETLTASKLADEYNKRDLRLDDAMKAVYKSCAEDLRFSECLAQAPKDLAAKYHAAYNALNDAKIEIWSRFGRDFGRYNMVRDLKELRGKYARARVKA